MTDQSDAGRAGTFRHIQAHSGTFRHIQAHSGTFRYILMADQSDAGRAGIFSWWTNQTQNVQVYSHDGPIRRALSHLPVGRAVRLLVVNGDPEGGDAQLAHHQE
eukprot:9074445-Pyramimonas_sp.AAC.1